jgi:hypothetical protein
MDKILDDFDSGWSLSSQYMIDAAERENIRPIRIVYGGSVEVEGFTVWFNNHIPDSRSTVMNFNDWKRVLSSNNLSDDDRIMRMAMLGGSGSVHPFASDTGNRGFFIINTKFSSTWAEVWDEHAIRRVRIDFEGRAPTIDEVPSLLRSIATLQWPE